jgi:methionyl-tRNA synthetase
MNKKILVCTAWPYVHAIPHFGNIMPFLSADVLARWHTANGYEVEFVSGSDEHGSTIEFEAKKQGITPKELVDRNHNLLKQYIEQLGFSFTNYSRTSNDIHKKFVQDFYRQVKKNGFIEFKEEKQYFCDKDDSFLPDRFVVGTCPHCESDHALGNQCDECGRVLDPTELINPKCSLCGSKPRIKKTVNAFFKLKKLEKELLKYIEDHKPLWQERVINFSERWINEGLLDRPITRDLKWGIKAPFEEIEDKVIYVWAEAVLGYVSTLLERGKLDEYWKEPIQRSYFTLGKDNIPFHTIIFPALLMAHENYNLPQIIVSNEFIGFEGKQFSKTQNRGIWLDEVIDVLPADYWRFYMYRIFPENKDTDFSWNDFGEKINNELVANVANFVSRVLTLLNKFYEGRIPSIAQQKPEEENVINEIKNAGMKISELIVKGETKEPFNLILGISRLGNEFIQHEEPWKKPENKDCLATCAVICKALAIFLEPYLPFASQKLKEAFNIKDEDFKWDKAHEYFEGGEVGESFHLFDKIDVEEIRKKVESKRKYAQFETFDLRVAKVKEVRDHTNAEKMYIIKVDAGNLGEKQLCAGLKPYLKPEKIQGKNIILVANLKPATLRGEKSEGMLLAAQDSKDNVQLLEAPNSKPGDDVYLDGVQKKPLKEIDIEDFYAQKMKVKKGKIIYKDKTLKTDEEDVIVNDMKDGGEVR